MLLFLSQQCHSNQKHKPVLVLGPLMLKSKHDSDRLMVCLFYISISIQGSGTAHKQQRALMAALWRWRLFIMIANDVLCSLSTHAYSCGCAIRTELLSPSKSWVTSMLTYLRAQSLHHVTEEVIQLFVFNVTIICQDIVCKFTVICPQRYIIVIQQPLIRANSSASVCAFRRFRHSRETVFI